MEVGFGAFGKIPALGDFLRLGLPRAFTGPWDDWLQRIMVSAEAALGPRWHDCYLSAPIWRFTLAPGLAGASGAVGILMASVDRVGRRYPLTLAAVTPPAWPVLPLHFESEPIFERLEKIALDMLEDGSGRDDLRAALADLALSAPASATVDPAPGRLLLDVPGGQAAPALAAALLHGFSAPSVWSALLATRCRVMVREAMPHDADAPLIFDIRAPAWERAA